jgi:ABC-type multidrug transport system ATPase subunit
LSAAARRFYRRKDPASDNHRVRSLFELEGVTLSRGGDVVLDGVDARIPPGASCIAGPSGSGKSTFLRVLNRLAEPDCGMVRYWGEDVCSRDVLALRREVCLVPQLPALVDGTVQENVSLGTRLAHRPCDVDRLLPLVGLDESFRGRDALRLSVGEQQRVMLARALALDPRVLLLDEPTSALDEAARDSVERTLVALRDRTDISLVVVTHDLEQAARLANWVLRLDRGRVESQGAIAQARAGA